MRQSLLWRPTRQPPFHGLRPRTLRPLRECAGGCIRPARLHIRDRWSGEGLSNKEIFRINDIFFLIIGKCSRLPNILAQREPICPMPLKPLLRPLSAATDRTQRAARRAPPGRRGNDRLLISSTPACPSPKSRNPKG